MANKKHGDDTTQKLAVIYARYSSHNQRDVSIDQQVKADREFADRLGLKIIDVYADRALTGTNDNRPEFQRMIEDSKKHAFGFVIVYSLDRFARDRYDSVVYKRQLKENGVRVLSAMENISDDPTGVLLESMLEGLAEYYSKELSSKIRRGLNDNASKCMVASYLPFGYRKGEDGKFAIEPQEAEVVREIFSRVLHNENLADIARDLNERGIKTKHKSQWNKSSFGKLLSNERYIGYYIFGDYRIENGVPAILDRETFYAVQERLKLKANPRNNPVKKRRDNSVYLLTGKAFCGHCGSAMVGKSGTSKTGRLYTYYACKKQITEKGCDKQKIGRDRLEYLVAKALKEYALQDGMLEWLADKSIEYQKKHAEPVEVSLLKSQLKQVESSIKNILVAIEQGIITPSTKDRLNELEDQKTSITAKIALKKPDPLDNLTRDDIISAMSIVRVGDLEDKDYQELLFNMFLRAVYLYDDKLKIVFNYTRDGHDTAEIPFDIETVDGEAEASVRLNSSDLHQIMQIRTEAKVRICFCVRILRVTLHHQETIKKISSRNPRFCRGFCVSKTRFSRCYFVDIKRVFSLSGESRTPLNNQIRRNPAGRKQQLSAGFCMPGEPIV